MMTDRVGRSLRRAWRDNRTAWTRRCRWYESATTDEGVSIRLNFAERFHAQDPRSRWVEVNCFYNDRELALLDMERFVAGERALTLRNEHLA